MTTTVDVFDDFVRVRWGDLEPAARLVVLDPEVARAVTAEALARLRSEWTATSEEGRPVERARRLVLATAVARATPSATRRFRRSARPDPSTPEATTTALDDDAPAPWEVGGSHPDDPGSTEADPVIAALVAHLGSLDPLDRALLAGAQVWDAHPDEVAHLLDLPPVELRERDRALRAGLRTAHEAARDDEDGPASSWRFDDDLAHAVDVVLRGATDPPDPAALVVARARRVRRRTVVLGGAVVATVAGVGAAVALRDEPVARVAAPPVPGPSDRVWFTMSQWPARGPLAGDPSLRAFVSRRTRIGDRILWAGDLGTRRLVVVWSGAGGASSEPEATLRVFSGRRGTEPASLDELGIQNGYLAATDAVAVAVPDGPEENTARTLLVVLGHPSNREASYSRVVTPTPSGDLLRTWTPLPLTGGVSATVVEGRVPPGLRARLGNLDGPVVTTNAAYGVFDAIMRGDVPPAEGIEAFVAASTGIPADDLATRVLFEEPVPTGFFDDQRVGSKGTASVVCLLTTTPDGAVLRSNIYRDEVSVAPLDLVVLVPQDLLDTPSFVQGVDVRPGVSRFLVLHPKAASVQLVATTTDGVPRSLVVPTKGRRVTALTMDTGGEYPELRIVLRDARGKVTYDSVQVYHRFLLDG
ncbi:hypothetical protein [Oryzobacter telluris]|uniref:hypothetical protein n=1 Tax=Oryzobacter telluris TaxID=3149179 RepID=UPI00370D1EB8